MWKMLNVFKINKY